MAFSSARSRTGSTRSTSRAPSSPGGRRSTWPRRAHRLQGPGRLPEEAGAQAGAVVGYKIGPDLPQSGRQTGLRSPATARSAASACSCKASVRANRWTRLGVELEIILTVNSDVPAAQGHALRQGVDRALCRRCARRRADRGSRRRLQSAERHCADHGCRLERRSLLARPTRTGATSTSAIDGSIASTTGGAPAIPDVMGHCYNSLAWLETSSASTAAAQKGMIVSHGSMVACIVPPGAPPAGSKAWAR